MLIVLAKARKVNAKHRNIVHVVGLARLYKAVKLRIELVEYGVVHAGAHLFPGFVLPAFLHPYIQVANLFLHLFFAEGGILLLQILYGHGQHCALRARNTASAAAAASALLILAGHYDHYYNYCGNGNGSAKAPFPAASR